MGTIAYREQQVGTQVHRWWSHPLPGYGTQFSILWVEMVHIMELAMLQRTMIKRIALTTGTLLKKPVHSIHYTVSEEAAIAGQRVKVRVRYMVRK